MTRTSMHGDEHLQELWGGYGLLLRRRAAEGTSIVKEVRWPPGRGDRSHARKMRSYQVESRWYASWAAEAREICPLPAFLGCEERPDGLNLDIEDMDAAGYTRRASRLSSEDLAGTIRWLARFHATFLGRKPDGLWKEGSYWHLATRPEELSAMPRGPLRDAAVELDRRLARAAYRSIVHGDAKPDNICLRRPGEVAMVDFQYAGGGCGMRDIAYLLDAQCDDTLSDEIVRVVLDGYFMAFRAALAPAHAAHAESIESEWRILFPVAWLDFQRFLQGWRPAYARPSARLERRIRLELERAGF